MIQHHTLLSWQGEDTTYYIRVDATVQAAHMYVNTVTDHPVERGANITDHVRPDPVRLNLVGVVSNAPISLPTDNANGAVETRITHYVNRPGVRKVTPLLSAGVPIQIAQTSFGARPATPPAGPAAAVMVRNEREYYAGARVLAFSTEFDRARAVFEELVSLRTLGTLIRVETDIADYDNMVIESLTVPRDVSIGDALQFELTLKQVILAESELVAAPTLDTERKSKGTLSTQEDPAKTATESQTILVWLKDRFGL